MKARGESLLLSLTLRGIASQRVGVSVKTGVRVATPAGQFLPLHPHRLCGYSSSLEVGLESGQLER